MNTSSKSLSLHYQGYCNTPLLWKADRVYNLSQLELDSVKDVSFNLFIKKNLRLGKLAERFAIYELQSHEEISIIAENIQIQENSITLGELDAIIDYKSQVIHLEIVYKFYLYDASVGISELDHWIGPNRKDSLIQKLDKLKHKQLPILYHDACKAYLKRYELNILDMIQNVLFKAQLFIPLNLKNETFEIINNECIKGFYIKQIDLKLFKDCKFVIPDKIDWFLEVQTASKWLILDEFKRNLDSFLKQQLSPLCWIKYPNGETEKCFVVWW